MREILQHVNSINGMKGSLIVTPDGLPIVSALPDDLDVEATAGLGACMGKMISDWSGQMDMENMTLGMMETKEARLFISSITWGFLVAVGEKHCPLGEARLEMRSAAEQLNEICAGLISSLHQEEAQSSPSGRLET